MKVDGEVRLHWRHEEQTETVRCLAVEERGSGVRAPAAVVLPLSRHLFQQQATGDRSAHQPNSLGSICGPLRSVNEVVMST